MFLASADLTLASCHLKLDRQEEAKCCLRQVLTTSEIPDDYIGEYNCISGFSIVCITCVNVLENWPSYSELTEFGENGVVLLQDVSKCGASSSTLNRNSHLSFSI